ncbi:MAG: hypothetical protein AB7E79_00375 [Rhodospirillaceae bacterium]
MYFLVERDADTIAARFASKNYGLMVGQLMAQDRGSFFELRKLHGGAVASFTASGDITRCDH